MKKTIAILIFSILILAACSDKKVIPVKTGYEKAKEVACKVNPWCK